MRSNFTRYFKPERAFPQNIPRANEHLQAKKCPINTSSHRRKMFPQYVFLEIRYPVSSIGNGGPSAFLQNALRPSHPLYYFSIKWKSLEIITGYNHWIQSASIGTESFGGKLYVLPIESAFKYSHQLDRK